MSRTVRSSETSSEDIPPRPIRPLDTWSEQKAYAFRLSQDGLSCWLECLFENRPFPIILGSTEPAVFAVYIFEASPLAFQQRIRAALRELVQNYHPAYRSLGYLSNLTYVCGQIRITEAYALLMRLIYSRAFEGKYASDYDEAAGRDLQSNLIAAAAALRPWRDKRVIRYCKRVLEGELPSRYAELSFQVLWESDENAVNKWFPTFVDIVSASSDDERFDSVRRHGTPG